MAWAATTTSVGNGDWNNAGTWSAGVPDIDDFAEIDHTVTLDGDRSCSGLYVHAGKLVCNAGWTLTFKDVVGTHALGEHILVASTGDIYRAETGNYLKSMFLSASSVPTYPVKMRIVPLTTADTRTLELDFWEFRGFQPYLGNGTYNLWFNTGDVTTDGILDQPMPMQRSQKIDERYCEGRTYSRVYPEGGNAGTIDIAGLLPWAGMKWHHLQAMRDSRTRVVFISQFSSMGKAYIESVRFGKRDGPYLPFNATLVEDR